MTALENHRSFFAAVKAAAVAMEAMLAAAGVVPRLETDAPATVGVNLNLRRDAEGP